MPTDRITVEQATKESRKDDLEAQLLSIPEKPSMATQESAERMHPDLYVQGPCGAMPVWRK